MAGRGSEKLPWEEENPREPIPGEAGAPSPEPPKIGIDPKMAEGLRRAQFERISSMSDEELAQEGKRLFGESWQGPTSRIRNALREEWDSLHPDLSEAARTFSEEERERAQEAIASRAAPEVPTGAPETVSPAAPEVSPKRGFLAGVRERFRRAPKPEKATEEAVEKKPSAKEIIQLISRQVLERLPLGAKARERIGDPEEKEIVERAEKAVKAKKIFGHPAVTFLRERGEEMVVGGVVGATARIAFRGAVFQIAGASVEAGLMAVPGGGLLGGAAAAAARELWKERRGYKGFIKEVVGEEKKLTPEKFAEKFKELKDQLGTEANARRREALKDKIRYLQVELKREAEREKRQEVEDEIKRRRQELKSEKDSKKRKLLQVGIVSLEKGLKPTLASGAHLGALVETVIKLQQEGVGDSVPTEREKLIKEIMEAKAIDRRRLLTAIGRGAAFGAIGGVVGGAVADWMGKNVDAEALKQMLPRVDLEELKKGLPGIGGLLTQTGPTETPQPTEAVAMPGVTPSPTEAPSPSPRGIAAATEVPSASPSPTEAPSPAPSPSPSVTESPSPTPRPSVSEAPSPKPSPEATPTGTPKPTPTPEPTPAPKAVGPETGTPKPPSVSEVTPPKPAEPEVKVVVPKATEVVLSTEVKALSETVKLPSGSNPWNEVAGKLKEVLHRDPTNAEILRVTKAIAKESGIKVPEWGLNEGTDQHLLPVGYELKITPETKSLIQQIAEGKMPPEVPQAPVVEVAPKPPVTEVVTKELPLSPPVKALGESFELKKGADGWVQIKGLLTNTLAQDPTNAEVTRITKAVAEASGLDPFRYSGAIEGQHLLFDRDITIKFTPEVKGLIQQLIDSPSLSPKIEALPEFVYLPPGTDGIAEMGKFLEKAMRESGVTRKPTRGELLFLAKAIAKASGIDPNQVDLGKSLTFPVGKPLRFTPAVKGILQRIIEIKST